MKLSPHFPVTYGFDLENPPTAHKERGIANGGFLKSFDERLWLFQRFWLPEESEAVKATLMVVHGTVDHSGVYKELAEALTKSGVAVFAMDMRGWGLSDGERMYIDNMDTFVQDVNAFYHHIHSQPRYATVKHRFLLGKSIGGIITAYCLLKYKTHWTGYIGLSGAYQFGKDYSPSPLLVSVLAILARLIPKTPLKTLFDEHKIVRDETALQAWRDDDLSGKPKVTVGYLVTAIHAKQRLTQECKECQLDIPMFLLCGDADQVVTPAGHNLFLEQNGNSDKSFRLYPGGYHNLLAEPALKAQVIADIMEWISQRA